MVKLKYLKLTDDLKARLAIALAAREEYPYEEFGSMRADTLVFEFAQDVMQAIAEQDAEFIRRVDRLPARASVVPVVNVALAPKRQRRA
jgi:hypothetical protein